MSEELFPSLAELWWKGAALVAAAGLLARLAWVRGLRPWRAAFICLGMVTVLHALPAVWEWRLPVRSEEALAAAADAWERRAGVVAAAPQPVVAAVDSAGAASREDAAILEKQAMPWKAWLVCGWALGVLLIGGWLAAGRVIARRWAREAEPLEEDVWRTALAEELAALALPAPPRLALHPAVPGPCTIGGRRAVILLPPEALEWCAETRRAVLRHELAHVQARDARWALVRGALLALHWPNPLVWLATIRARREEELTADQSVLTGGADPRRYAEILLALARRHRPSLAAAVPMARLTAMEGRFQAILAGTAPATRPWWRHFARAAAVLSVVGVGCSQFGQGTADSTSLAPGFHREVIDLERLERLLHAAPFSGRLMKVRCRVTDGHGRVLPVEHGNLPAPDPSAEKQAFDLAVRAPKGQPCVLESVREFVYPGSFDFPDVARVRAPLTAAGGVGRFPVTPTTPKTFETRETGWSMELRWTENQGPFLVLEGNFRETAFEGFIDCPGEPFSPIVAGATTAMGRPVEVVLTENRVRQPTFTTRETPFQVAALPGKTYRLPLNLHQRGAVLELTVEEK